MPNTPPPPQLLPAGGGVGGNGGWGDKGQASNRADLAVRPPTTNVPEKVPKQISNKIAWDYVTLDSVVTVSTSAIVETNYVFYLGLHPQASSWAALYDQWCIPQASIQWRSEMPPGSTGASAQLYTALDFDNNANLGSIAALQDYATCKEKSMFPQASILRSVRPCNKLSVSGTSGSFSALDRNWVDSGMPSVYWFGIRSIFQSTNTAYNVAVSLSMWFAFRNQI
jgi:hypothetical protein